MNQKELELQTTTIAKILDVCQAAEETAALTAVKMCAIWLRAKSTTGEDIAKANFMEAVITEGIKRTYGARHGADDAERIANIRNEFMQHVDKTVSEDMEKLNIPQGPIVEKEGEE